MDKYSVIQQKIEAFFNRQSFVDIENKDLKIIISTNGKLVYEIWAKNKIKEAKLDEIIVLNGIESFFVKNETIEKTIADAIKKLAKEENSEEYKIQIIILAGNRYCLFKDKKYIKEINLKQIL